MRPLRIGIDARLVTYRRGMGNVVYHLLQALAEIPGDYRCMLYVDDPAAANHVPSDQRFTVRVLRPAVYPLWEQVLLPLAAAGDRVEILHCPANTAPLLLSPVIRLVLTVHDVMYMLPTSQLPASPSLYQRLGRLYRQLIVPRVVRRAAAITTVSHYSRQDMARWLGLRPAAVHVIPEAPGGCYRRIDAPDNIAAVRAYYGLTGPFVLALGAVDPRKNTRRVIEAFALVRRQRATPCQLMLVGLPPAARSRFEHLARRLGVADETVIAGFVPEEHLAALYNAAECLLYPSLYEGFGLPVIEAMACGTPVVTSPVGSIPEVAGDAALLVDPTDTAAIAGAVRQLLDHEGRRRDLVERGERQVAQFSWARAAQTMLNVYRGDRG